MATIRRPAALDGKPSIPSPRSADNVLQSAITNIRSRLDKTDAAVNQLYVTADASSPAATLESLQTQITALTKTVEVLSLTLASLAGVRTSAQTVYLPDYGGQDAEEMVYIPIPGPVGPAGPPGPAGPTILIPAEDGEDGFIRFTP